MALPAIWLQRSAMSTGSKFIILLVSLLLVFHSIEMTAQQPGNIRIDELMLDSKYEEAVNEINRALASSDTLQNQTLLEIRKTEALIRLGRFEETQLVIQSIEDQLSKSSALARFSPLVKTTKGFLFLNQGRNDLALETFNKAIDEFDQLHESESLDAAQALSYKGLTFINTGKYVQAEELLQHALALRQARLPDNHELIAGSYNDLGLIYSLEGDNDKALDHYEKALAIYKNKHGDQHPKIAIANTNIAVAYRNIELYGDAINDLELALKIWENIYSGAHPAKAFVLSNLGQTYLKMGNVNTALAYYENALKQYQASFGEKHPNVARVLNAIGNIKLSANQYNEALKYFQDALKANVADFNTNELKSNPALKSYYNGNELLYSLLFKAQALEAKYYGHSLKLVDLHLALKCLHTCDTLINNLRQHITNEADKIALGIIANEVYADGVRIAYNTGVNALKKNRFFEDAFYFAEKSKSAVLLAAIADAEAKSFAGIPARLIDEEKQIKSAIAVCMQKLAQKPTAGEEKKLREELFNLNSSYETFTKNLEKDFPEYFNLKFNSASPSILQLQSRLDEPTAVVSYFIDDKNKRLYIFRITKRKFVVTDKSLPKDFDKYITGLRNSLYFNDQKIFTHASYQLGKLLIPKLPGTIKNIIILPTGRLSIIPFETLLTNWVKNVNTAYKNLPYLLMNYNVRYEFSAGLILQKQKTKQILNQSIFLCAPVSFPKKDNLNDLPGTESEVKEISSLFRDKNLNRALYMNAEASEHLIKSDKLNNFGLLHFATHGIVDEKNPELSRIFLQTSDLEDGNLFAGEIYNLKLNANLVALSACQTGLGKISKGEGVIGLSRALVYAGAKNVLVSFWSVSDESTALLMKSFYRNLLETPSNNFSESLNMAKKQLINSEQYAAPYFWAPFVLIGF